MRSLLILTPRPHARDFWPRHGFHQRFYSNDGAQTGRLSEPLRILFFGTDNFSVRSLSPLVDIMQRRPDVIQSIDLVTREHKYRSRLKAMNDIPLKNAFNHFVEQGKCGLKMFQIDSFKDLQHVLGTPNLYNLIIAVSFGLLIPAELIKQCRYGGVNVHGSLLPDLRGAAPIEHAILKQRTHTGVTLQTLHPTKFDHGEILAQTPLPGYAISETSTASGLRAELSHLGGDMLEQFILDEGYLPENKSPIVHSDNEIQQITNGNGISLAKKMGKKDEYIDFETMTAQQVLRHLRAFPTVWDNKLGAGRVAQTKVGQLDRSRTVYDELCAVSQKDVTGDMVEHAVLGKIILQTDKKPHIILPAARGTWVGILKCTLDSGKKDRGVEALLKGWANS